MTAKMTVSFRPMMLNAHAVTSVIWASRGTRRRCLTPAANSRRNDPGTAGSGSDSVRRTAASTAIATAKVAASMRATAPPPNTVNSAAPASGATILSP